MTVTVDSNVVLDHFEGGFRDAAELIALHPETVTIQVANRTPDREATRWAGRLRALGVRREPNFFRLDMSRLDGGDVLAEDADVSRLDELGDIVFPEGVVDLK